MREELVELLDNAIAEKELRSSDGELISTFPFKVIEDGMGEWLADYLIAHGVTVETGGDLLPRESVINGVLMQMQASLSPVCMEEFLRNLDGVTVQKWIPVSERLPEDDYLDYLCQIKEADRGFCRIAICYFEEAFYENDFDCTEKVTHWMPLPAAPKGVE